MNYSEMKDHEINAAVGEALGWNAKFIHQDDSVTFRDDLGRLRGRKNYCNSWADAGSIIQKYGISLHYIGGGHERGGWGADDPSGEKYTYNDNPLRAAMIVLLMMQEKPDAA